MQKQSSPLAFTPYKTEPVQIAHDTVSPSCICLWEKDCLIIATSEPNAGNKIKILKRSIDAGDPRKKSTWTIHSTTRLTAAPLQLSVLSSQQQQQQKRDLLMCLTENEGLNLYSLPQFNLKGQAPRTRDALCFSWDDSTRQLATALKRNKVLLYSYDGSDFVVQKEFVVPEPPMHIELVSGNIFVVGISTCCVCIPASSSVFKIPLGSSGNGGKNSSVDSKSSSPSKPSTSRRNNDHQTFMNRILLTKTANPREVIITMNGQSSLYDDSGKIVASRPSIHWNTSIDGVSSCITSVVIQPPYIIAALENTIQVQLFLYDGHSNATANIIETTEATHQTIVVPHSGLIHLISPGRSEDDGDSYASEENSILCFCCTANNTLNSLHKNSYIVPAEQLLHLHQYEEALELCRLVKHGKEAKKLVSRIRLVYGQDLLQHRRYEEAMLLLGTSELCTPVEILKYFSVLVPHRLLLDAAGALHSGPDNDSASDMANLTSMSLSSPPEDDIEKAVSILTPYLLSYRNRLAAAASDDDTIADNPKHYIRPLSMLVDTALLNALLIMPDSGALLQFIQRPNQIEFESGAASLESAGRYAELVALYKARERHTAALDLLEQLSLQPENLKAPPKGAAVDLKGLPGVWAAVKYLLSLDPPDFSLISCHSKWILKLDPEAGIDMFVQLYPSIDPSAVMPILTPCGGELAALYLDRILGADAGQQHVYEKELGMLYLQQLLKAGPTQATEIPAQDKLCKLILTSDYIEFDALLRLLPSSGYWEVKASLLERLERHLDALRIFVHKLHAHNMAEAYCDRVMNKKLVQPMVENVYTILIQVLLEQEDRDRPGFYRTIDRSPEDQRWKEIAMLLSRKRNAIPPLQALGILPGQIPISSCIQFLEAACRGSSDEKRQSLLLASLYRARYAKAQSAKSDASSVQFTVSQERACCFCNKRLGVAALVYLQDGNRLAHFSCYRRYNS